MSDHRREILTAVMRMIQNKCTNGEYPTTICVDRLENYIKTEVCKATCKAVGWTLAEACDAMDRGHDIRHSEAPVILDRALTDLEVDATGLTPPEEETKQ
jgi:hypothetical protein